MIRPFSADGAAQPIGPYSHGVQCSGSMIFLSGQIPLRADGTMLEGTIEEQTRQIFANIRTILSSQGASLTDIVKTTVFLKNMNDFAAMNAVYAAEMGEHRPARSAVEVARLPKDAQVEIEVIACVQ
ncbi:MAG: Rid family detoxifying hydrolase [Candidatus Kapabacteria bacterium]|nr:deaminase [Ignavibacteria bacterium]MBP6510614.1 Rid family detoxifying hydrolase [Candidatus Kapabacteria bacterium]MBK6417606.1 deaminase [Ignavibacteria bacterium]MBK6761424.1 deaminase [Ignavibacteria bacterium]MBK7033446.1 deaminase [Ignavibacteria bacterium]